MATKKKKPNSPAPAPAPADEPKVTLPTASEHIDAEEPEVEVANQVTPELSPELRARLKGIFQDDPDAEAYYSQDGETFLNADQYEARANKKDFTKYIKPE